MVFKHTNVSFKFKSPHPLTGSGSTLRLNQSISVASNPLPNKSNSKDNTLLIGYRFMDIRPTYIEITFVFTGSLITSCGSDEAGIP